MVQAIHPLHCWLSPEGIHLDCLCQVTFCCLRRAQILYHDRLPITLLDPIIILLLSLMSCKLKPALDVAYGIFPLMKAWVNSLHYKKLERQVWFPFIFIIGIYNEKSGDLSTILLPQFLFCPRSVILPCNYIFVKYTC